MEYNIKDIQFERALNVKKIGVESTVRAYDLL